MNQTILMACADEGFAQRLFRPTRNGRDYTCTLCGWQQRSSAAGAAELCRHATWNDLAKYKTYAEHARIGGETVPEIPPNFHGNAIAQALTLVRLGGETRLAIYTPRLGCPLGLGSVILDFLQEWDRPTFEAKVRAARFAFGPTPTIQHLEMLRLVHNAPPGMHTRDGRDLLGQCSVAYLIDLDASTLALYVPTGCAGEEELAQRAPKALYRLDALPSAQLMAESLVTAD